MAVFVLLAALVPVVAADLRWRIIPDVVVAPALLAAWALAVAAGGAPWWGPLLAAALVGGLLLVPALVRPDGMGMGDVKLAALIGAALGAVTGLLAVLAGLLAAAAWGGATAMRRGVRPSAVSLPLAPFLAAGVLAVIGPPWLVHSLRAADPGHHPEAAATVRPPALGVGLRRGYPEVARQRAAHGARHRCGCRARCGAPAPRWPPRRGGGCPRCRDGPRCAEVHPGG